MNTSGLSPEADLALRKSVQQQDKIVHSLPKDAVLSGVLQTIETQLQKRGLLPPTSLDSFNPVWFLAETERNIFLWRRGLSIDQHERFEFWVDVPGLLEKRLSQLEKGTSSNPFINPLWGLPTTDPESAQREKEYLASFLAIMEKVRDHAHALSKVGLLLERELSGQKSDRTHVVLPGEL